MKIFYSESIIDGSPAFYIVKKVEHYETNVTLQIVMHTMTLKKLAGATVIGTALLMTGPAFAQTTTGTTSTTTGTTTRATTTTTTPGVPNTGAGGDAAATMLILASAALLAIAGAAYLRQRFSAREE